MVRSGEIVNTGRRRKQPKCEDIEPKRGKRRACHLDLKITMRKSKSYEDGKRHA